MQATSTANTHDSDASAYAMQTGKSLFYGLPLNTGDRVRTTSVDNTIAVTSLSRHLPHTSLLLTVAFACTFFLNIAPSGGATFLDSGSFPLDRLRAVPETIVIWTLDETAQLPSLRIFILDASAYTRFKELFMFNITVINTETSI